MGRSLHFYNGTFIRALLEHHFYKQPYLYHKIISLKCCKNIYFCMYKQLFGKPMFDLIQSDSIQQAENFNPFYCARSEPIEPHHI
jgi:hypothetical protein